MRLRSRRLRLPALAAVLSVLPVLPVLLAGMLAAPSSHLAIGSGDGVVRTVLVDPPPLAPSDADLGLTGAHPPVAAAAPVSATTAPGTGQGGNRGLPIRVSGTSVPARVLLAYRDATDALHRSDPACHLSWSLLAGIGEVESGHAAGGAVDRQGRTLRPILGPVLDGTGGVAAIADSDQGRWDGDRTWDRAVGPMQFIPTSWAVWGRDGDGDGRVDPSDIDDAALATASYLCAGTRDLRAENDRRSAVFSYNHSWDYVDLVLAWADAYATGTSIGTGRVMALQDDGAANPIGPVGVGAHPAAEPTTSQAPASAAPIESSPTPAAPEPAATSAPPSATPGPTTDPAACPSPSPSPSPSDSPSGTATVDPGATPTESPTPTSTASGPDPTPTPTGTDPTASPSPQPTDPCPTSPASG